MAITFKQAFELVEQGKAEQSVCRFITHGLNMSAAVSSGDLKDDPVIDDYIVVVALLQKLLNTPDGKRALHRNYKGKTYEVLRDFGIPSPEMDIGMRLVYGIINREDALRQLKYQLYVIRQLDPDLKTIKRILDDLEQYAGLILKQFGGALYAAGWDGKSLNDLPGKFTNVWNALGDEIEKKHD